MKIAAVVVTFNRKEYLVKNIEALLAQVNAQLDILIIDNASTDGTKEAIQHYIDAGQIHYVNTGENLGAPVDLTLVSVVPMSRLRRNVDHGR